VESPPRTPVLLGLGAALVATVLASATVGPVSIDLLTVSKAALNAVGVPAGLSVGVGTTRLLGISVSVPGCLAHVRLPVLLCGRRLERDHRPPDSASPHRPRRHRRLRALAAAGTVMQGFFRNPLADPSIIGVSSGAAVGAVAAIVFAVGLPLQVMAFAGAILAAFAVYIATRDGETPVATLLLAGVAIQTFLGAVISYMLVHAGESLEQAIYWLMGHLQNSTWGEVEVTLPPRSSPSPSCTSTRTT